MHYGVSLPRIYLSIKLYGVLRISHQILWHDSEKKLLEEIWFHEKKL